MRQWWHRIERITQEREPIIITQNGEARAVLIDIHSYEQSQETLALLQILALGEKEIQAGKTYPLDDVIASIRSGKPWIGSVDESAPKSRKATGAA